MKLALVARIVEGRSMSAPKVLLVTADDVTASTCSEALKQRGFDPLVEQDGEAALLTATRAELQALVIDLDIPVIDGLDVATALRGYHKTSHLAVVAIGGAMTEDVIALVESRGCDRLLARPVDACQIVLELEHLLAQRARRAA
jgi:DNA-binding response OmpR family regulator